MANKFQNPWDVGGEYWESNALSKNTNSSKKEETEKTIYINNKSSKTIYYKPEEGNEALPVPPKSVSYEPLDGVATHKNCNMVYKVFTGATVEIDEKGNVDPDYYGVGDLVNYFAGGWNGQKWLEGLHEKGDYKWDALFETSKNICK